MLHDHVDVFSEISYYCLQTEFSVKIKKMIVKLLENYVLPVWVNCKRVTSLFSIANIKLICY